MTIPEEFDKANRDRKLKELAKDMIEEYRPFCTTQLQYGEVYFNVNDAKKCALICTERMKKLVRYISPMKHYEEDYNRLIKLEEAIENYESI